MPSPYAPGRCACTCDGRLLLVATAARVHVLDRATMRPTHVLAGHTDDVTSICAHAKLPGVAVTSSLDGTVRVWDLEEITCSRRLDMGTPVLSMTVHGRTAFLATQGAEGAPGKLLVVDLPSGEIARHHKVRSSRPGPVASAPSGDPSDPTLAALDRNSAVLYAARSPSNFRTKHSHTRHLTALALAPGTGDAAPAVCVGDTSGRILLLHGLAPPRVEHREAATGVNDVDGDADMAVDDAGPPTTGREPAGASAVTTWHWHQAAVGALCASAGGGLLLSGGAEGVVVVWDLRTGARRFVPRMGGTILSISPMRGPGAESQFLVRTSAGAVAVVDVASMKVEARLVGVMPHGAGRPGEGPVGAPLPGARVLLPGVHGTVQEVNLRTGLVESVSQVVGGAGAGSLGGPDGAWSGARVVMKATDRSGALAAAVCSAGSRDTGMAGRQTLCLLEREPGAIGTGWTVAAEVLGPHQGAVCGLCMAASGAWVATTGRDGRVCLWRVPQGNDGTHTIALDKVMDMPNGDLGACAMTPDASLLAVSSGGCLSLIATDDFSEPLSMLPVPDPSSTPNDAPGPEDDDGPAIRPVVESMAFSTDGHLLSCSVLHDRSARPRRSAITYDVLTGTLVTHVCGALEAVGPGNGVAFIAITGKSGPAGEGTEGDDLKAAGRGEPRATAVVAVRPGHRLGPGYVLPGARVVGLVPVDASAGCAVLVPGGVVGCLEDVDGGLQGEHPAPEPSAAAQENEGRAVRPPVSLGALAAEALKGAAGAMLSGAEQAGLGGALADAPSHALAPAPTLCLQVLASFC